MLSVELAVTTTSNRIRKTNSAGTAPPADTQQPLAALESRAVFLLSQIGHHIAATFTERLEPLQIQPRHFAVLNGLAANDGATQQHLAHTLQIHRNVMVGLVDDLERHGFAKREPHPDDRRAHAVRLTTRGRKVLQSGVAVATALEFDVTQVLAAAERVDFIEALQRVATGLGLEPGSHPSLRETGDRQG